jgi:hypothetical protein
MTARILNLGTGWSSMFSFTLQQLYPREGAPVTHWIEGCVGLRAGLDAVDKKEIFLFPSRIKFRFIDSPAYRLMTKTKLRGLYSASKLYRPSDRRLSAKLMPSFPDRCHVVSATDPHGR